MSFINKLKKLFGGEQAETAAAAPAAAINPALVSSLVEQLGGSDNIVTVESCAATRLRVQLKQANGLDEAAFRAAGANGLMQVADDRVHVLVGLEADAYALEMNRQLA